MNHLIIVQKFGFIYIWKNKQVFRKKILNRRLILFESSIWTFIDFHQITYFISNTALLFKSLYIFWFKSEKEAMKSHIQGLFIYFSFLKKKKILIFKLGLLKLNCGQIHSLIYLHISHLWSTSSTMSLKQFFFSWILIYI